jgi:hypothetical protein
MITYTFTTSTGSVFKRGKAASKKSLRRTKERADLAYGAYLGCKATDEDGNSVHCY